jgi:hypothetical protein
MKVARLVTGCSLLVVGFALQASADEQDNPSQKAPATGMKYALPDDPKAAVIVLDFKGGFTPPRISDEPTLTIRADGAVDIPAKFEGQKAFKGKLDIEEVQQLLAFIIEKQKFLEYDPAKVREKLAAGGPRLAVADAATTVIRVTVDGRTKEASHYALGIGGKIEELERLAAIQRRLMQVQSVVQLGGKDQVAKWLEPINAELKKQHPDAAPLTGDDLQSGGERVDGSVYLSFARTVGDDPAAARITSAFVNKPAAGEAKITVTHR